MIKLNPSRELKLLQLIQKVGALGYFIIDIKEEEWFVSEVLADMLEFEKQMHEGLTSWLKFIHPDDQEDTMKLFQAAIEEKRAFKTRYRAKKQKSEQYIWLELDAEVTYDELGGAMLMLGTAKNITEVTIKQLELERKNKILCSIAWQQSHGLRSPLSRALGILIEMEEGKPEPAELSFLLQNLRSSLEEMDGHVKEIVAKVNTLEVNQPKADLSNSLSLHSGEREHIYVVDDDLLTLKLHEKLLARVTPDTQIHLSPSGADFLKRLKTPQRGRRLILLDINMPNMSGWEVLESLEQMPDLIDTEVVMVSSSADWLDQQKALEHKLVLDYIVKPLSYDKIVKLVNP